MIFDLRETDEAAVTCGYKKIYQLDFDSKVLRVADRLKITPLTRITRAKACICVPSRHVQLCQFTICFLITYYPPTITNSTTHVVINLIGTVMFCGPPGLVPIHDLF